MERFFFLRVYLNNTLSRRHSITMGPKKAAAAKKKEGTPENGVELTPEEKAKLFMLTCQSLQVQLCKFSLCKLIVIESF
jgi:hypothetical protein